MASPYLVDPIKPVDPVDALRLLVVDLEALADRQGLKQKNRALQHTLDATQQRVFGPRTVIMLMGETAAVNRRFLERLLGPQLAHVPEPVTGCVRLEHGAEAECSVSLPQGLTAVMPLEQLPAFLVRQHGEMPPQSRQTIRLPNPTLAKGLAVIDTPAMDTLAMDTLVEDGPGAWLLEAAAEADCWIFVLGGDHLLSERSLALLRRLPRPCPQLDIVVEGAESLSGEARQAARDQLIATLREHCGVDDPRLTLLASPSAEGESGSFWSGRFATFQSVTLLRGREHWLHATRAQVADALSAVSEAIESRWQGERLDVQKARMRQGQRDLEVLRMRLNDSGLVTESPRQAPSLVSAVVWPAGSTVSPPAPKQATSAVKAQRASAPEPAISANPASSPAPHPPPQRRRDAAGVPQPQTTGTAANSSSLKPATTARQMSQEPAQGDTSLPSRVEMAAPLSGTPYRAAVHNLSAAVALLFKADPVAAPRFAGRRWRLLGVAVLAVAACSILWALWPAHRQKLAQWSSADASQLTHGYDSNDSVDTDFVMPPFATPVKPSAPAAPGRHMGRSLGDRELIADPSFTDLGLARAIAPTPRKSAGREIASSDAVSPARPTAAVRTAPPHTAVSDTVASPPRRPGHRGRLGLGKVWHWIRRGETVPQANPAGSGAN